VVVLQATPPLTGARTCPAKLFVGAGPLAGRPPEAGRRRRPTRPPRACMNSPARGTAGPAERGFPLLPLRGQLVVRFHCSSSYHLRRTGVAGGPPFSPSVRRAWAGRPGFSLPLKPHQAPPAGIRAFAPPPPRWVGAALPRSARRRTGHRRSGRGSSPFLLKTLERTRNLAEARPRSPCGTSSSQKRMRPPELTRACNPHGLPGRWRYVSLCTIRQARFPRPFRQARSSAFCRFEGCPHHRGGLVRPPSLRGRMQPPTSIAAPPILVGPPIPAPAA